MTGIINAVHQSVSEAEAAWEAWRIGELEQEVRNDLHEQDQYVLAASLILLEPAHLETCSLLWIAPDMVDLLIHAAATLPAHDFEPSRLPWRRAFVVLGKPVVVGDVPMSSIMWSDRLTDLPGQAADNYLVTGLVRHAEGRVLAPVVVTTLRPGTAWADVSTFDGLEDDMDLYGRLISTLWLLVQQKVAVQRVAGADRAANRRWSRDHDRPPPEVTVVELRRPIETRPHEDSSVVPVEWSHRWIVDGHWRNQYHPSTGERVPTWIAPHIKGPEDKPLVVKRKINAWVR